MGAGLSAGDITVLLQRWGGGEEEALEQALPELYEELRGMARRALGKERREHTLQPTALVHEAYFRLRRQEHMRWQSRSQFLGIAAELMRRILVDHARRRLANKRGGDRVAVTLDEGMKVSDGKAVDLIALDSALSRLAELDGRQARIVELRYFAGLGVEDTAAALEISPRTVKREWSLARAWLRREMDG